jgi:hypothetical protein
MYGLTRHDRQAGAGTWIGAVRRGQSHIAGRANDRICHDVLDWSVRGEVMSAADPAPMPA